MRMYLPMAHAEGKFVAANDSVLNDLRGQGRLAVRYAREGQGRVCRTKCCRFPTIPMEPMRMSPEFVMHRDESLD